MEAQLHPVAAGRLQDPPALLHGEDALLAEDVAEGGEPALGHGRDHLLDEQAHVAAAVGPVLERHLVGAQEGGDHRDGVALDL